MRQEVSRVFQRTSQIVEGYDGGETVMGIDPSLTNTGVCIMSKGRAKLFTTGWSTEVNPLERLRLFREEFNGLLYRYEPKAIALEGYSFGSEFSRPHSLGELGAVIKLCVLDSKVPLIIVPPQTLKKFVRGIGKGTKNEVMKDAKARWGFSSTQNDEIDAGALAFAAAEVQYRIGQQYGQFLRADRKGKGGAEVFTFS